MNIPDEASARATRIYPEDYHRHMKSCYEQAFIAGAEWARREALREAAKAAESDQFWDDRGDVLSSDEVSYNTARREAAVAIRALAEGEQE